MVKSADTADLKSADLNRSWGFKSPSGHQNECLRRFFFQPQIFLISWCHFWCHFVKEDNDSTVGEEEKGKGYL